MRQIHCRRVILMIVFFERWRIVSQRRFTTFSNVAKTSFRKPCVRSSRQICSIGFISGVYGGIWNRTILSGSSNPADLCHAAPSQQRRIISSLYFSDSCFQKETFTRHRLNCTINIAIFANMVAWNARTLTFFAPATLCFVNTSKSCFVLEH